MSKTMPVMTRVKPEVKAALAAIARDTNRSESFIAAEAITAYIEANAWQVELIRQRVADSEKPDARFVPHDEVEAWFMSLGTENPLPKPTGKAPSKL